VRDRAAKNVTMEQGACLGIPPLPIGPFHCAGFSPGAYFPVDVEVPMMSGQTGILRDPNDGVHWGTTVASLVVGAAFLAL
jgi:hypothetical protein